MGWTGILPILLLGVWTREPSEDNPSACGGHTRLPRLRKIPTYDWNNERVRDYSETAVRDLIAQKRMVAMIGRNDRLLFAQFVRPTTKNRPASRPKYKVIQIEMTLPGTETVAALFAIDESEAQDDLELYRRAIYSQVVLSLQCRLPLAA